MTLPVGIHIVTPSGTVSAQGTERDWELDIDRGILWGDPVGSWPRGRPLWLDANPQKHDRVDFRYTIWMDAATAKKLESWLPPYKGPTPTATVYFQTQDASNPIWPGFGNYVAGDGWKLVNVTLDPLDVMGQKGPIMDLWGYRMTGTFAACGQGTARNERNYTVPTSTAPPAFLATKFGSHQIQDASSAPRPLPVPTTIFPVVQHGRRRDARVMLDHMEFAEAEAIVNFYRAIRQNKFVYPGDSGDYTSPLGPQRLGGELVVAKGLTVRRGSGWWYEGELDISATSVA